MTPPAAESPQRLRVRGFIGLAVVLLDAVVVQRLVPTFELALWARAAAYIVGAALAGWGFPSVPSMITLCLLGLWSSHGDVLPTAEFNALLWGFILVGAATFWRRRNGVTSLLLVIGASGFATMFTLHAFSSYTHALALDGFAWNHWVFQSLAAIAAVAILCSSVGVARIIREWKERI